MGLAKFIQLVAFKFLNVKISYRFIFNRINVYRKWLKSDDVYDRKNIFLERVALRVTIFMFVQYTYTAWRPIDGGINISSPKPASTIREYALGTYYFLHSCAKGLNNEVKNWRAILRDHGNHYATISLI